MRWVYLGVLFPAVAAFHVSAGPRRLVAHISVSLGDTMLEWSDYTPPPWAVTAGLTAPKKRISLGRLPTPVHAWNISLLADLGVQWFIKRDDLSGFEVNFATLRRLIDVRCGRGMQELPRR